VPQRSYAHAAALGAIAAVCLAGCSAGADVDPERFEVAIRSHAVANLAPYGTVTDVDCRPADPAVFVALRDDHSAPVRGLEWRTKDRAEDVARSYGATLYVDC